jgi:hypothetical protein
MSEPEFVIEEFTAVTRNTLLGFARVRLPSGLVVHDCAVHVHDGRAWVSPPAKAMLSRDGVQMKDAAGKLMWSPIISFASRELRDRFIDSVLAALRASHPAVLAEAGDA